jgi:hypothetical protein
MGRDSPRQRTTRGTRTLRGGLSVSREQIAGHLLTILSTDLGGDTIPLLDKSKKANELQRPFGPFCQARGCRPLKSPQTRRSFGASQVVRKTQLMKTSTKSELFGHRGSICHRVQEFPDAVYSGRATRGKGPSCHRANRPMPWHDPMAP